MRKPQPKAELVIQSMPSITLIWLWTSSHDAALWVEDNAAQFGNLCKPTEAKPHWDLFVSPEYDFQEVVNFLNSYTN